MSIQLTTSNSLSSLARVLAKEIQQTKSVFRPVYIVTQTEGMNSWLRTQIAESTGIAANIRFVRPNDIIHHIFQILGGTYIQSISVNQLSWLLYKLIDEEGFKQKYPQLAAYHNPAEPGADIKRMALSEKIADLFDQYQIYRAEMMDFWNRDEDYFSKSGAGGHALTEFQQTETWQKELWIKARDIAGSDFPDKNYVGRYILSSLENPQKMAYLREELPVVYFFGLSLITEYHLQIFSALSKHIRILFLMQNPAPSNYWFEDKSEKTMDFMKSKGFLSSAEISIANPLLTGWGKLIQNTYAMLFENEDILNSYDETGISEPTQDTLLHNIQRSVFLNQKDGLNFSLQQINDESITVSSCYSPAREVEVLYNYLVHLVDQKGENLSARDIVVMVTDIDLYASYIKAVFDNAPYRFNYTLADELTSVNGISDILSEIFALTEQQFTAEKIVGLLDFSILRKQFQITDVVLIRRLVNQANIRFGFTGSHSDESVYVSWQYGLKRLMYGLCMSGEEEFGSGKTGFYPVDMAEGAAIFEVTRFVYFVEMLMQSIRDRRQKRTPAAWVNYTEEMIQIFLGGQVDDDQEDFALLAEQLDRYNVLQQIFAEPVSYEVFTHHFLPSLSDARRNRSFATGGVTFCSLIPMRSIPFKVVAALGMDFDKFPRREKKVSFDLLQLKKRKGDRDITDNDKHLFLETVLSAGEYLYLSYIGQSVKDNSSIPPSSLLDELLDFIARNTGKPEEIKKSFVQKHPLHGFSRRYNAPDNSLYSYLVAAKERLPDRTAKQEPESMDFSEIDIRAWVSFFKNPFEGFYNQVLHIYYHDEESGLEETEIFQLDNLEKWAIRNKLAVEKPTDIETLRETKVKTGQLPLRNMGYLALQDADTEVDQVRELYWSVRGETEEEILPVTIRTGDIVLTGDIGGIYGDNLIGYTVSGREAKHRLAFYLYYLLAVASGKTYQPCFISVGNGIIRGTIITKEDALARLKDLVDLYVAGHQSILAFHPNLHKGKGFTDAAKFAARIHDYFNNLRFPCTDPYQVKEYKDGFFSAPDIYERYQKAAKLLQEPVDNFLPTE